MLVDEPLKLTQFIRGQAKCSTVSDECHTVTNGRDIYISPQKTPPLIKDSMQFQHQYSQKKQKWYHLPFLENAMSVPINQLHLSLPLNTHIHSSFVLRLSTLRILRLLLLWVLLIPPLRSSLHRYRLPSCSSSSSFHHVLHVRSVAQILVELTDVAADVLVGLEAEGYDWRITCQFPALCLFVLRHAQWRTYQE